MSGFNKAKDVQTSRSDGWLLLQCVPGFLAFLFLAVSRRNGGARHPGKGLCLLEDGHRPGFAPHEEAEELRGE